MVIPVNNDNFATEVLGSTGLVVVDFNAAWCGPCQMLAPVLAELAEANPDVKFVAVNVDENAALAQKYAILSIPCVIFFQNGQVVKRQTGFMPKSVFAKLIQELKS